MRFDVLDRLNYLLSAQIGLLDYLRKSGFAFGT